MADVFLMGTSGDFHDPKRSMWREPIKAACKQAGIDTFDPVVPLWNDEAAKREAEALRTARVVVMAVTADTAGIASLAESGWVALSALQRRQAFALFIDPMFQDKTTDINQTVTIRLFDSSSKFSSTDSLEDASRRARKLVISHAAKLAAQMPGTNFFVAKSIKEITDWTIATVRKLQPKKP